MKLLSTFVLLCLISCLPLTVHAAIFGTGPNQFEIEFVTIGDPGNRDDFSGTPRPAGKVDYIYRIAKYEVSEAMIDAAVREVGLQITKNNRGPNKPATGISWLEAATFINWLNTSQGHQAAYNIDGNGNFNLWSSGEAWQRGGENRFRHRNTVYFLPSMDEWYKAAYYDPGRSGIYYDFPTGSNSPPGSVLGGTAPGTAVYNRFQPADITQAGGLSPYGTMGQGGNVFEWEETAADLFNNAPFESRGLRGGSNRSSNPLYLSSSYRRDYLPTIEGNFIGFRVASIPEPSSLLLGTFTSVGLLMRRRRVS